MSDFVPSEAVEGDWERGYAAAQAYFRPLLEAAAITAAANEAEIERLKEDNRKLAESDGRRIGELEAANANLYAEVNIERLYGELGRRRVALANAETEIERLLAALEPFARLTEGIKPFWDDVMRARAAIAKAEGQR